MARALPDTQYIGRATLAGPVIGPYVVFNATYTVASGDQANRIAWAMQMPAAFYVEQIAWQHDDAVTAGAAVTMEVSQNTTLTVTADTTLMSAVPNMNTQDNSFMDSTSDGTGNLVLAARAIAKGDILMIVSNDGGGALADLNVQIAGYFRGYMTDRPGED